MYIALIVPGGTIFSIKKRECPVTIFFLAEESSDFFIVSHHLDILYGHFVWISCAIIPVHKYRHIFLCAHYYRSEHQLKRSRIIADFL